MRASIFISCLVDQFFPDVGEAMVQVLRRLGVALDFPPDQTCCGQPAFNMGYRQEASDLARRFLDIFANSEYIVVPSGSCGSMAKVFYHDIFRDDPIMEKRAQAASSRIYEFSQFLVNVLAFTQLEYLKYGENMGSYMSFITGPSRSGDIEQTITVGGHGPKEAHCVLLQ